VGMWGSIVFLFVGVSLMLLQLLRVARVAVYFRNDYQIQLFQRSSSGWFSLSVVPI